MQHIRKSLILVILFIHFCGITYSQKSKLQEQIERLCYCSITPIPNENYEEFYELTIRQLINHKDSAKWFNQRVFLGFRAYDAPNVLMTEGYGADYATQSGYANELALGNNANLILVEHRYFGKSVPDSLDWNFLTTNQAAADYHEIKIMFDKLLTGKWFASGISKGGQAAISYKINYPEDVGAVIVYGTSVKDSKTVQDDFLLTDLSKTSCGFKLDALQEFLFKNKNKVLGSFTELVNQKNYNFHPFDNETVLDYMLLELPFSFWQNGLNCDEIPDTTSEIPVLLNYLIQVVPPRLFTTATRKKLEPAFYMFYHELGYYEYNTIPFKKHLVKKEYSNQVFAPLGITIPFDSTFQKRVLSTMNSSQADCFIFIYGQNDPWYLQSKATKNVFVLPQSGHKTRIEDFPTLQRLDIYLKLWSCLLK